MDRLAVERPTGFPAAQPKRTNRLPPIAKAERRWTSWLRDTVVAILLALALVAGLGVYYTERYIVATGSMEPTLHVGDVHWAVRRYQPPKRGEIVAFTLPDTPDGDQLIKRVIGLPGERIEALDGIVLIDLGEINEAVWVDNPAPTGDFGPIELGPDQYFLMGDNRSESIDARHFGAIPSELITYVVRTPPR